VCRNQNFRITSKSKSLESLSFKLNKEESVQAYGASYKYEHKDKKKSMEENKKLDYEFYLVALDYSDVISAQSREEFSERIALEVSEKSKGLPVVIVGDWRNDSEENEMEILFTKFNLEFSDLGLMQAKNNTVINTDKSNPVDKKFNNLLFNLEIWGEGPVKYLGACGKLSGQERYQKTIGNDCPTIFTLERKL